jgi:hypothetical protein
MSENVPPSPAPSPLPPPPPPPLPGIRCPTCSSVSLTCEYTRKLPGQLVRVRGCQSCGRRCRTVERVTGPLPPVAKRVGPARKAAGQPPAVAPPPPAA